MSGRVLNKVVLVLLYVCMAAGLVYWVSLPFRMDFYLYEVFMSRGGVSGALATLVLVLWMLGTLLCLFIVWDLTRMVRTVGEDPFTQRNVAALRRMGIVALTVVLLCAVLLLITGAWLLAFFAAALLLCGLFSLVLYRVFQKAVAFKQENDLTI